MVKVPERFHPPRETKVPQPFDVCIHELVLIFALILLPLSASAERVLDIENGSTDLLKSEHLTKPFTILDQLLYSLDRRVNEEAKYIRPEANDFRLVKNRDARTSVQYEKENSRIAVVFELKVKGMDDPWQDVCQRHSNKLSLRLGILGMGSKSATPETSGLAGTLRRMFFQSHLGPIITHDSTTEMLQPFIDAIVVIGRFSVVTPDEQSLTYSRWCALDINTERMTYFEHKH